MRADRPTCVAAVMLTLNQRETTLRALRSLVPQLGVRDRVVVWDNGSTDGTIAAIGREFGDVVAHWHPENAGVASGRNAGAALAMERFDPEYLLFLDNDLVLRPGFVDALRETLAGDPMVGQVQGKLLYLDEPTRINDGGGCRINFWLGRTDPVGFRELDRGQCEDIRSCTACGGAMMVRAPLFRELGGFDGLFDPYGPEDLDFSLRLQRRGWRALYNPRAVALHEANHTYGAEGYSAMYARSKARHWLRFLRRHGTPVQRAGFFLVGAPLLMSRMIVRELRQGNPGAIAGTVRGVVDALRGNREGRD